MLLLLVVTAGQVVLGVGATQQMAAGAARTAAVAHDDGVHAGLAEAGATAVDIDPPSGTRRPGDPVTVRVTRQVVLLVLGRSVEVTADATFRTEDVP